MGNLVNISTVMHEFYNSIAIGYKYVHKSALLPTRLTLILYLRTI